jgi:Family of unknown function (DUF6401)
VTFGVRLSIVVAVSDELSEITLRLAGQVGASGLALSAGFPGLLAAVDQHAAEVRDALAVGEMRRGPATHRLLGYARGFVEAAIGRGWFPRSGADWESLRLAAVCQLVTQAQARPQAAALPLT